MARKECHIHRNAEIQSEKRLAWQFFHHQSHKSFFFLLKYLLNAWNKAYSVCDNQQNSFIVWWKGFSPTTKGRPHLAVSWQLLSRFIIFDTFDNICCRQLQAPHKLMYYYAILCLQYYLWQQSCATRNYLTGYLSLPLFHRLWCVFINTVLSEKTYLHTEYL